MKLEKMDGGYRLLLWPRRHPDPAFTWKKVSYKFCFRIFRDTYGLQFSLTVGK